MGRDCKRVVADIVVVAGIEAVVVGIVAQLELGCKLVEHCSWWLVVMVIGCRKSLGHCNGDRIDHRRNRCCDRMRLGLGWRDCNRLGIEELELGCLRHVVVLEEQLANGRRWLGSCGVEKVSI